MADNYPECVIINKEISEENPEEGLKELLVQVKPEWKDKELTITSPGHGLQVMNRPFIISLATDIEKKDAVVVKLLKKNTSSAMCQKDEDREFHNWRQLNKYKVGVPLLARFTNGVIQKFIPGSLLTVETMVDPHISKLVAAELAKFHDASLRDEMYTDKTSEPGDFNWMEFLMRHTMQRLKEYETKGEHSDALSHYMPVDEMEREFKLLCGHLKSLNMEVVLCHGDCWRENIIYSKDTDKVTLIDYEGLDKQYSPYDLGVFFAACSDNPPEVAKRPSEEFCKEIVKNYLVKRRELCGKSGEDVTDEEIERNYRNACLCIPLRSFFIGVVCLYFYLQNKTDFGWKIAIGFYQHYKDARDLYWPKQ